MNSHQIAPRDSSSTVRRPSEPVAMHRMNQRPRALPKRKSMTDAPQSSASRLSELLKKLTRPSSSSPHDIDEHDDDDDVDADVRASWPSIRTEQQKESFGSRAQHAIFNAWTSLHRSSSSPLFTPPQFLLRTRRRISQSFNLKVVQAVGKDMRRSESEWRNSFSDSRSSHGSTVSSWDEDTEPESLNLSERLSLTVGRHVSRDFAPMLTEGSPLECRVREIVYALLRNPKSLEGHTCHGFFVQQESFTSTRAVACRHYLKRTRDTISDVIQFIVEYRLRDLREELLVLCFEPNDEAATQEIHDAVRRAAEEYFCFSLRYELRQWCIGSSEVVDHRSRFKKTLAKWSTMDPASPEFGLQSYGENPHIDQAITMLQEIDTLSTPSRKMRRFLAACDKLSQVIAPSADTVSLEPPSPTSRVCLGAADAFLPLMIFAVSRSKLTDPLVECAMLYGLFPFASEFGEEMYYLTMFEAALEFIRTHS